MITQSMFIICSLMAVQQSKAVELNEKFSWNKVEFNWPNTSILSESIENKNYIPENNVPVGLSLWKNKIFITIPRWKNGVASTLNYVTIQENKSPLLLPYPSWQSNLITDSVRNSKISKDVDTPIVSVMRTWVDVCDRLWVLDDGVEAIFGDHKKVVDKSILIYDLKADRLVKRHFFEEHTLKAGTFLGNIVVDVTSDTCDNAYAYMADHSGFGLIVYDLKDNSSWFIEHSYFHPNPLAGEILVGGIRAHWTDGVLGLTLSNVRENGYRTLYFHPLTSTTQFEVSTKTIQNRTWSNDINAFDDYKVIGERGPKTQSTTNCYDNKTEVIVYTQVNRNGLACWKSTTQLNPSSLTLFAENTENLEFPCDIKIDSSRIIWVLSNRLPKFLYGQHDQNTTNIRIMYIDLDTAIEGTLCK